MDEGTVRDERDTDGDIQEREAIEEEHARAVRRRGQMIEGEEEDQQPSKGVEDLDRELGRGVKEGKERDVASDGEGAESTEISAIAEGDKGCGNEDQQNGFLMDVPAEEEGGVGAEGGGADEGGPGGVEEEADEGDGLEEEGECEGG